MLIVSGPEQGPRCDRFRIESCGCNWVRLRRAAAADIARRAAWWASGSAWPPRLQADRVSSTRPARGGRLEAARVSSGRLKPSPMSVVCALVRCVLLGAVAAMPNVCLAGGSRRRCYGDSRRKSQAFAKAHSRSTVADDIPSAVAASSIVSPAKNRSSTIPHCRESIADKASSAWSSASTSTLDVQAAGDASSRLSTVAPPPRFSARCRRA